MTTFNIKIIALLTMVIDHVGLYFFPEFWIFRILGRLSFILFAWLIANGANHTKDLKKYMIRLFLLGVVSQYPYHLLSKMNEVYDFGLNIGFTLGLGLLAIMIYQSERKVYIKAIFVFCILILATLLKVDYGPAGILTILLFYVFYKRFYLAALTQTLLYLFYYFIPVLIKIMSHPNNISASDFMMFIQPVALFSLLFIYFHNKNPGIKDRYLFYIFYPVHFVIMIITEYLII
jgi:hypothetical protein